MADIFAKLVPGSYVDLPVFREGYTRPALQIDQAKLTEDLNKQFEKKDAVTVDLAGGVLTESTDTYYIPEGKSVTLTNGSIQATSIKNRSTAVFAVSKDSSIVCDNTTIDSNGAVFCPAGDSAKVIIKNSTVNTTGYYGFATNASVKSGSLEHGSNFTVSIENSTIITHNDENDNCALCLNVPATITIKKTKLVGDRQGMFVRAGNVTVEDSEITTIGTFGTPKKYYDTKWKSGNECPAAAITVGNFVAGPSTTYPADAVVDIKNSTITGENGFPAVYVDSNDTYKGSFTATGCTINGDVIKGQHDTTAETKTTSIVIDGKEQ